MSDLFSEFDALPPVKQREKRKRGRPPTKKPSGKVIVERKKTIDELYNDYLQLKKTQGLKPSLLYKRETQPSPYISCVVNSYRKTNEKLIEKGRKPLKWNEFEYEAKNQKVCVKKRQNPNVNYARKNKVGKSTPARMIKKMLLNEGTQKIKQQLINKNKISKIDIQGKVFYNKTIPLELLTLPILKNIYKSYGLKLSKGGKTFNKSQLIERLKKLI
jgi:hypothetical protein